jgi:hypothetical protein
MTTSTELDIIEPDFVEPHKLTKREAKALDKKVRNASDKLSTSTENLLELLEQAAAGQIHEALELPSWTAWFKDAVQVQVSDRFERKELVKLMSGKGMSQRAIAGSLGVSQKTVDRDLDDEPVEEGATVTSLDGVERPANRRTTADEDEQEPLDVEAEEISDEPMKSAEIVTAFADECANLYGSVNELELLAGEPKWDGARKRVAKANLNNLGEMVTALQKIIDDLMSA